MMKIGRDKIVAEIALKNLMGRLKHWRRYGRPTILMCFMLQKQTDGNLGTVASAFGITNQLESQLQLKFTPSTVSSRQSQE